MRTYNPDQITKPSDVSLDIVDLITCNTGYTVNRLTWNKGQERQAKLKLQSQVVAKRLEEGGVEPYQTREPLMAVGVCTGLVEVVTPWRNINLIPEVAAYNRRQTLAELNHFTSQNFGCRYWVITSGEDCPITDVRSRCQDLERFVSRELAPALREHKIDIVYRGTELTVKERAHRVPGVKTAHVHANVVLNVKERLPVEAWSLALRVAHRLCDGRHLKDNGRLVDTKEVCKYVTKPNEVLDLTVKELCELHRQLYGLHLSQPLGELRSIIESRVRRGVRLSAKLTGDDWEFVEERLRRRERGTSIGESLAPINQVVGVCRPAPRFTNRLEPVLLVRGYDGASVEELLLRNDMLWVSNCASDGWISRELVKAHTSTVTVKKAEHRTTEYVSTG